MTQTLFDLLPALGGGILIGLAAALLMGLNGQILGISGITAGAMNPQMPDRHWRWAFLAGILTGGLILTVFFPEALRLEQAKSLSLYAVSGLLVGYGARLGGGCTSGHGVCGLSRLSPRALFATFTFMSSSIVTVLIVKTIAGNA